MSRELKYMVVSGKHELDLEKKVTDLLNNSESGYTWDLSGGVSVCHDGRLGSTPMFYQAIIGTEKLNTSRFN